MKHTIKLGAGKALVIQPQGGRVRVDLTIGGVVLGGDLLTPETAGLLSFAVEAAIVEATGQAIAREGQELAQGARP